MGGACCRRALIAHRVRLGRPSLPRRRMAFLQLACATNPVQCFSVLGTGLVDMEWLLIKVVNALRQRARLQAQPFLQLEQVQPANPQALHEHGSRHLPSLVGLSQGYTVFLPKLEQPLVVDLQDGQAWRKKQCTVA